MSGNNLFPVFLKLHGRPCLVVGAGAVALEKVHSLLAAGGTVRVIAPEAGQEIQQLARDGRILWHKRCFEPTDLDGAFLVVTAANPEDVNGLVHREATARGIICNSVDDPPNCDFYFPAVVRRGDLQIAISTAGKSPALAQRLRGEIEAALPEDRGDYLDQLGELRQQVLETRPPGEERRRLLHTLAGLPVCESPVCPARTLTQAPGRAGERK